VIFESAIGIFNVVKFPNAVCQSNSASMNGTCYTQEECDSREGTASGSCAEGYGVCCIISLSCGSASSDNCTYINLPSTMDPPTDSDDSRSCTYTICPQSSDVTRIRFDMQMFSIAGPGGFEPAATYFTNGLPAGAGDAVAGLLAAANTHSINVCTQDRFSISGTNGATPVICGLNNGQHMIVDTDGQSCVQASFSFGSATTSRQYNIHVIQHTRGEKGGPPGCLQYFDSPLGEGTVTTFNYQGHADTFSSIHLANQHYKICVRPIAGACQICWSETMAGAAGAISSFSVSLSAANAQHQSVVGAACIADYITILGGNTDANTGAANDANNGQDRFCGRLLNPATGQNAGAAVCSAMRPFELGVHFDETEVVDATGTRVKEGDNELSAGALAEPIGTMGFSLNFVQTRC